MTRSTRLGSLGSLRVTVSVAGVSGEESNPCPFDSPRSPRLAQGYGERSNGVSRAESNP